MSNFNITYFFKILNFIKAIPKLLDDTAIRYLQIRKKAQILIDVTHVPYDLTKDFDAYTQPVNELHFTFANTSDQNLTIHEIKFIFFSKSDVDYSEQVRQICETFSFEKRNQFSNKKLTPSEQVSFRLSYNDPAEETVIDNLLSVSLLTTHKHQSEIDGEKLHAEIAKVKKFQGKKTDTPCETNTSKEIAAIPHTPLL